MLGYFPTVYPDELLYSTIARYHRHSVNFSWQETSRELFGKKTSAIVDLPCLIEALCSHLPLTHNLTPHQIIHEHTLYPFYAAYLPEKSAIKLFHHMCSSDGSYIHAKAGFGGNKINPPFFLRFCPICAEKDFAQNGELYWHRSHHLPGVPICSKHHIFLLESKSHYRPFGNYEYIAANDHLDQVMDLSSMPVPADNPNLQQHIAIAKYATSLLDEYDLKQHQQVHYLEDLGKRGYVFKNGHINHPKLQTDIVDYFGADLLEELNSKIDLSRSHNWPSLFAHLDRQIIHPIRHILFNLFLSNQIVVQNNFETMNTLNQPSFGRGPWPCLFHYCEHYMENVIKTVKISYSQRRKSPLGTFACPHCGFAYYRSGKEIQDPYQYTRVMQYGKLWHKKLREFVLRGLPLRVIARKMGASVASIKRIAIQMGLQAKWIHDKDIQGIKHIQKNKQERRSAHREKLSSPPKKATVNHRKPRKYRVNWAQRDEELLVEMHRVVNSLLSMHRPKRISRNAILKRCNIPSATTMKHLERMPKSKAYLDKHVETFAEFHERENSIEARPAVLEKTTEDAA